jgi:hypothetical protein
MLVLESMQVHRDDLMNHINIQLQQHENSQHLLEVRELNIRSQRPSMRNMLAR